MAPLDDDQLREMAQHRGLKLVKSRKRTPGVGDYGRYGLTDTAGKPLLGIGDDGLTATAADVETYLRTSTANTWKQSTEITPDRPPSPRKPAPRDPEPEEAPVRRRSKASARTKATPSDQTRKDRPRPRTKPLPRGKPVLRLVRSVEPQPEPRPEPARPALKIRPAAAGDAGALAGLINQLSGVSIDRAAVSHNLAQARRAKAGLVVAERGAIIGCCGWAVLPTVYRGKLGRLTLLVVDKDHRRSGVATALLAEAEKALARAGCRRIEAISDIMINNAHNFFRTLKFEQASYRFVREIDV